MTSKTLTLLALAGVTAAALSTAAFAQEAPDMQEPGGHGGFAMLNFDSMDADKDGKLTKAEVDASRLAAVTKADSNADGKMSADELTAMHLAMMTERAKTMSANMIERMDSDADGLLSAAEMAAAPGPGKMFDRIDADSDGAITKVEADAAKDAMMARGRDGKGHGRGHGHGMGHGMGMGMDSDNN